MKPKTYTTINNSEQYLTIKSWDFYGYKLELCNEDYPSLQEKHYIKISCRTTSEENIVHKYENRGFDIGIYFQFNEIKELIFDSAQPYFSEHATLIKKFYTNCEELRKDLTEQTLLALPPKNIIFNQLVTLISETHTKLIQSKQEEIEKHIRIRDEIAIYLP